MIWLTALTVAGLAALGLWMLLDRNLKRVVLGIAVLGNAINLAVFAAGPHLFVQRPQQAFGLLIRDLGQIVPSAVGYLADDLIVQFHVAPLVFIAPAPRRKTSFVRRNRHRLHVTRLHASCVLVVPWMRTPHSVMGRNQ